MRRYLLSLALFCLVLTAAGSAFAQAAFYCVKPDGMPMAGIILAGAAPQNDPSVVCNAVIPQCYLTCGAVEHLTPMGTAIPPNLPMITVTQQMLDGLSAGPYQYEPRQTCDQQYQACAASCRGDAACLGYCKSVRTGCGTGNPGFRGRGN